MGENLTKLWMYISNAFNLHMFLETRTAHKVVRAKANALDVIFNIPEM